MSPFFVLPWKSIQVGNKFSLVAETFSLIKKSCESLIFFNGAYGESIENTCSFIALLVSEEWMDEHRSVWTNERTKQNERICIVYPTIIYCSSSTRQQNSLGIKKRPNVDYRTITSPIWLYTVTHYILRTTCFLWMDVCCKHVCRE